MNVGALLTSAGINIAITLSLLSLYSILRKQPSNAFVYFRRRLASVNSTHSNPFSFDRFVPSPGWVVKAWETTEEEILAIGGIDAAVFCRIVVFSVRIFCIAAVVCMCVVLPVNYYGQEMTHNRIHSESLEVFTIANVRGSRWLWAHCLALYVVSCSACMLLYFENRSIAKMRIAHIAESPMRPSYFTVLVRAVPWNPNDSYSDLVRKYFTDYYESSYLSHQMVYRFGTIQKLMDDAEKLCKMIKHVSTEKSCKPCLLSCGLCGTAPNSFKILSDDGESVKGNTGYDDLNVTTRQKECPAAFVFFKTRRAAIVAAEVLQSANPMLWVTQLAPEPQDVLWSNLCIPYRQLWLRKLATRLASLLFMFVFIIPVTFVQGLTQLEQLVHAMPFLEGILRQKVISRLVTGYLPSVILMLFLYAVPPTMLLFSLLEGSVSRSGRRKSACTKVLFFIIWNVFFVNVLSGSFIGKLNVTNVDDIYKQLSTAVPIQASFFMTYVFTSGWASLSCEIMRPFALIINGVRKHVFKIKEDPGGPLSFPYHTEVPKLLLFGLIGFICSINAPLILPFLVIYFALAFFVYRNQIINVYIKSYDTGGQYWPIFHRTTIFSLVLTQIICLGIFGIKKSSVAIGFTVPLVVITLLFSEYCAKRFFPIFKKVAAQVLTEMDREDEHCGRIDIIHQRLHSAYCQVRLTSEKSFRGEIVNHLEDRDRDIICDSKEPKESK